MNDAELAAYTTRLAEIAWGLGLIAITMVMHALGMTITLMVCSIKSTDGQAPAKLFFHGITRLILASWMIVIVHLLEVFVWAYFLHWNNAISQASTGAYYYFSLNQYTTVGSNINLDLRWRLLEGMLAAAGLLSFAWSTGILLTLAQQFLDNQIAGLNRLRKHPTHMHHPGTPTADSPSASSP